MNHNSRKLPLLIFEPSAQTLGFAALREEDINLFPGSEVRSPPPPSYSGFLLENLSKGPEDL